MGLLPTKLPLGEQAGWPFPVWIATVGGVGFAPVAPGTCGSAVGALLFAATWHFGLLVETVLLVAVFSVGVWSASASESAFGRVDDGRIVIDEVGGQLVALLPLFALQPIFGSSATGLPGFVWLVTAFVAFRVFDIAKPGPVAWAERNFQGGVGVMADDLVAGGLAAVLVFGAMWASAVFGISGAL
jgi:phosphatidylglycerophosphatase A